MSLQTYQVPFFGNLTRDPELRVLDNSNYVVNFAVANTPRYHKDGEWKNHTTLYQECTAFGKLAQHIADSLTKGSRVVGIGNMRSREWESNGEKRSVTEIVVEDIGPSLLFNSVSVHKNENRGGGYNAPSEYKDDSSSSKSPFDD